MIPDPRQILAETPLVLHRGPFAIGAWPDAQLSAVFAGLLRARDPILCVSRDDREVTALAHERSLSELPPPRRAERGWCVLTLDQTMAWDVVGVLAVVTQALAAAGVPVGAVTAFSRDHVLVPARHLDAALAALAPICARVDEG